MQNFLPLVVLLLIAAFCPSPLPAEPNGARVEAVERQNDAAESFVALLVRKVYSSNGLSSKDAASYLESAFEVILEDRHQEFVMDLVGHMSRVENQKGFQTKNSQAPLILGAIGQTMPEDSLEQMQRKVATLNLALAHWKSDTELAKRVAPVLSHIQSKINSEQPLSAAAHQVITDLCDRGLQAIGGLKNFLRPKSK